MRIDQPTPEDVPQLRQLWKKAFADGDDYLDIFFSHAFDPARCRCITENGQVLAALYWFRVSCNNQKFAYLYAIATDTDHRGKGLCRMLVENTKQLLTADRFCGALLVPDGDGLAGMYRKMGFEFCASIEEFPCCASDVPVSFRRIDGTEYARLRRNYLPENAVIQEGENLALLNKLCEFYAGEDWIAAVSIQKNSLHCSEFLGNTGAAPGLLAALGCTRGNFRVPGNLIPFAMHCSLQPEAVIPQYFAFAFD